MAFGFGLLLQNCSLIQRAGTSPQNAIELDTIDQFFVVIDTNDVPPEVYRPTFEPRINVRHIELDLKFDWQHEEVIAKESLTITAWFSPVNEITLDARGFEIHELLVNNAPVKYEYDGLELRIPLEDWMGMEDSVTVQLDYTARPTLLATSSGSAITSDQGLYFIDPKDEDPEKPTQLWTQGEPESNSGWFALVDKPNDKFTQEIFLTVDSSLATLSNGRLVYSSLNEDGTRTDYWNQSLEHSGYLAMLAIGEFGIVKDSWNDLDVWYYVPKGREEDAKAVFGNTPEMLTFYSELLGVTYPWEKFHQVIVEDFVSGAMENTSAVIHGSFVLQTAAERIDGDYEDVVAHELFHHWFGDLVTCESWAQITMNEGFATYGEYLWKVYKYGQEEADLHLYRDLIAYFSEQQYKSVPLIRDYYQIPDDVFDAHSYQKGGRIIHALRQEIGDEAFFAGLTHYLEQNAYKNVESDHLRLALEKVSGRDLRWFFDQWYGRDGHPVLDVNFQLDSTETNLSVHIAQVQNSESFQFHLPLYFADENDSIHRHNLWVDDQFSTHEVLLPKGYSWFGVNADGGFPGLIEEQKAVTIWQAQAVNAPWFFARHRALNTLANRWPDALISTLPTFLKDDFWHHRYSALELFRPYMVNEDSALLPMIIQACADPHSQVRHTALGKADTLLDSTSNELFIRALNDSSIRVQRKALDILRDRDPCAAMPLADSLHTNQDERLDNWLGEIFAECGGAQHEDFFYRTINDATGIESMRLIANLVTLSQRVNQPEMLDRVIEFLFEIVQKNDSWWSTLGAMNGLQSMHDFMDEKIAVLEQHSDLTNSEAERLARWKNKRATLSALLEEAQENEDAGAPEIFYKK